MTDQTTPPPAPAPASPAAPTSPAAPAAPAGPNAMDTMVARYGTSQLLVALGALIIIVADVIFVIFGPYGYTDVVWACAASALAVVLLRSRLPAAIANNHVAVIVGAAGIALMVQARELLNDLSFLSGANVAVTYYLGMLSIYAGVLIMAFGAWRLWQGER